MTDQNRLIWCLLLCLGTATQAQRTVGDYCRLRNGMHGECRLLSDCSAAMTTLHIHKPMICGFMRNSPIVCCGNDLDDKRDSGPSWRPRPYRPAPMIQVEYPEPDSREKYSGIDAQNEENRHHRNPTPGHKYGESEIVDMQSGGNRYEGGYNRNPTYDHKHGETGTNRGGNRYEGGRDRYPSFVHKHEESTSLRKSQMKCKEYSQSVVHKVEALPLLPNPTPVEVEVARCDLKKLPLIVGGEKTFPGEFPHMAALGYQDGHNIGWNCGGSLISERYVLTAAHCTVTSKGPPVIVRLGELNLRRSDDGAEPQDFTISSIIRHPHYKAPAKYNDIALVRLAQTVQFSNFIRPACLYSEDNFPGNKTIAIGWGQIDYAEKQSDVLLKVALDIIDNNQCNRLYRSSAHTNVLPQGIISSMMCAGVLRGGKDTCHGDSGGPIQITSGQNKCIFYVIGITSFGKFCAAENAPGVYTRVSEYLSWIESEVWP